MTKPQVWSHDRFPCLVVDAVVEARHRGEDGRLQLRDIVEQLQNIATVEADADAGADGGRQRVALVYVRERQVRYVPVACTPDKPSGCAPMHSAARLHRAFLACTQFLMTGDVLHTCTRAFLHTDT